MCSNRVRAIPSKDDIIAAAAADDDDDDDDEAADFEKTNYIDNVAMQVTCCLRTVCCWKAMTSKLMKAH